MSFDHKNIRYCDECGRTIEKAHRVFQDKDYCSVCYPRVFPKTECTSCGGVARQHRYSIAPAICRKCNIQTRTCLRCDKLVPRAARIIQGKPVCPSCAPYFNELQICSCCGKAARRVSRAAKFGLDNLMCEPCKRTLSHKTCLFCGKHRPVHGSTSDGKPYCASCIPGNQQFHPCPGCGISLPGNGRSRCRSCLNLKRIIHEADLHSLILQRQWARELLIAFAIWLHERCGNQPNCFSLFVSHEIFFERLEAHFDTLTEITEVSLLEHFGVALLRQHLLATIYLQEQCGFTIAEEIKLDSAERSRIKDKLVKNAREPWAPLLKNYSQWLSATDVSLRTQRLYLRAAEKFCQLQKVRSDSAWQANDISDFLKKNSGSRASLYKFVSYCRSQLGWEVEVPNGHVSTSTSLPDRLKSLIKRVKTEGVEFVDIGTLSKMLALAFGYKYKEFIGTSWMLSEVDGSLILTNDSEEIIVPTAYVDAVRKWMLAKR